MSRKIIVACGGTGGHSFPGIAVARNLAARGHYVAVWSSGRAIEGAVMKAWSGPVFATGARQLQLAPRPAAANLLALWRCWREMRRERPDAVLAMGSYASFPPVVAAVLCRVPVILHEANTVPGKAVDFLSRVARAVAVSFEVTARYLPGRKVVKTGLPVRTEIAGQPRLEGVPPDAFTVFVTGGSQGAHRVNELLSQALPLVKNEWNRKGFARKLYVIHQTGAADEEMVRARYAEAGIEARVQAFEREMGRAFATADVVVARAGASTCFELALTGKPAFLIPLPSALRDHQHLNAEAFVESGAAYEGIQDALSPRAIANWLSHKAEHPEVLAEMARKMASLAVPEAAARVADLVEANARS